MPRFIRRAPVIDLLGLSRSASSSTAIQSRPIKKVRDIPGGDLDRRGWRRGGVTRPGAHIGQPPANKGQRYEPTPPSVTDCMTMLRCCSDNIVGRRQFAASMILWQGALRASELLGLAVGDLDPKAGTIAIRHGKGSRRATISMARWAWPLLEEWLEIRTTLPKPAGALVCVTRGPSAGLAINYTDLRKRVKQLALIAGITRRTTPHQFRHAWTVQAWQDGLDMRSIQLHLRHAHLGVTDEYLRSLGLETSHRRIYEFPEPMVPATTLLHLPILTEPQKRNIAANL